MSIFAQVIRFGRILRRAGFNVGSGQIIAAMRALELVGMSQRQDVRQVLFSLFVCRREQIPLFDQAFDLFWRRTNQPSDLLSLASLGLNASPATQSRRIQEAFSEESSYFNFQRPKRERRERPELERVLSYSPFEVLRRKDFETFSTAEMEAARALMAKMKWSIPLRKTRRLQTVARGPRLDQRRTIRANLRRQGEIVRLFWRSRCSRPRPMVVLCDISGSMDRYARMLLHFMHALTGGLEQVETFVFGTRLTRLTRHLRHKDVDVAVSAVAKAVQDWSGGTQIGPCLREFNYQWARRVLGRGAVVMIISDGWDRGDIPVLQAEMARLQRSCFRLIWLNPLLGHEGYEPLTQGIQAALPFIDDFLPVHNLESLEALGEALRVLQRR